MAVLFLFVGLITHVTAGIIPIIIDRGKDITECYDGFDGFFLKK